MCPFFGEIEIPPPRSPQINYPDSFAVAHRSRGSHTQGGVRRRQMGPALIARSLSSRIRNLPEYPGAHPRVDWGRSGNKKKRKKKKGYSAVNIGQVSASYGSHHHFISRLIPSGQLWRRCSRWGGPPARVWTLLCFSFSFSFFFAFLSSTCI